jgi:hypothetical protein
MNLHNLYVSFVIKLNKSFKKYTFKTLRLNELTLLIWFTLSELILIISFMPSFS